MSVDTKVCSKCGECKPATTQFFYKHSKCIGGLNAACKACCQTRNKSWAASNKEKVASIKREWKVRNPGKVREQANGRRAENADYVNARQREWREKNSDAVKEKARQYMRIKYQANLLYQLNAKVRSAIHKGMRSVNKSKRYRSIEALGCSFDFFVSHIERQFASGMQWEKMGTEIHIDHIVPLATAQTEEDVIRLNHHTNLRPMWAKDNLSKGAQITHLI